MSFDIVGRFCMLLLVFFGVTMVLLVVLFPGILGSLLTFLMSASRRVARETIKAVKSFRKEVSPEVKESLDNYLRKYQSHATKQYIANERTKSSE